MAFVNLKDLTPKKLSEGVELRAVSGDKMTLTLFHLAEGSSITEHAQPHEQIGTVLKGTMEMVIGTEKKIVPAGGLWVIPSNVVHKGRCVEGPAEVLEAFSPRREDFA
jgi:quercetin dioxygenase-like cupin family protein